MLFYAMRELFSTVMSKFITSQKRHGLPPRGAERVAAIFEISMSNSKYYIDRGNYMREAPLRRPNSTRPAPMGPFCCRCVGVAQSRQRQALLQVVLLLIDEKNGLSGECFSIVFCRRAQ